MPLLKSNESRHLGLATRHYKVLPPPPLIEGTVLIPLVEFLGVQILACALATGYKEHMISEERERVTQDESTYERWSQSHEIHIPKVQQNWEGYGRRKKR